MEWILHDDWPVVLDGFRSLLRPKSPVYLNVELPGDYEAAALKRGEPGRRDAREIVVHEWYNHFPARDTVLGWLSGAGFRVTSEREGDYYWHLLMSSP